MVLKQTRIFFIALIVGGCGFIPLTAQPQTGPQVKCALRIPPAGKRGDGSITSFKPRCDTVIISPSGFFAVFYDNTGIHAPAPDDANHNKIPDYVDSVLYYADYVFAAQITSMGYPAPVGDDTVMVQGSPRILYGIYLQEIGKQGLYGITTPFQPLGSPGMGRRFSSGITIDNNFSPFDSVRSVGKTKPSFYTTGIPALCVTLAHEFFHAVQLSAYPVRESEVLLHELSSTWMESRIFPDTKDYQQYYPHLCTLSPTTGSPWFGDPSSAFAGYSFAPLLQLLEHYLSDRIVAKLWRLYGTGLSPHKALDSAIRELSGGTKTLPMFWDLFVQQLYATGERYGRFPTLPALPQFKAMPGITFTRTEWYSPPSLMINFSLRSFDLKFFRCITPTITGLTPDSLDFAITASDTAFFANPVPYPAMLTLHPTGSDRTGIIGTEFSVHFSSNPAPPFHSWIYTNAKPALIGQKTLNVFPHPFNPEKDAELFIVLPSGLNPSTSVRLVVYSLDYTPLAEVTAFPSYYQGYMALRWNGQTLTGNKISPGIYGIIVEWLTEKRIAKLVVQRQ